MVITDKDWLQLEETLDRMIDDRVSRREKLEALNRPCDHNEGWIDALEHVLGIMRMRRVIR